MSKLHIKKGDTVVVLSGDDAKKKGKVISVLPNEGKVIVEGVNMVTKHKKPRSATQPGGLVHQEAPIRACKVQLVCKKCGQPARTGTKILADGSKVKYCKNCQDDIDD